MQCVNLTDDELWQAIAHNTTVMSALVYRRIELDAANTRNDVIHRAQLMQSNVETISKLERKYREYTDELRRRHPCAWKQAVAPAIETVAVEVIEQPAPSGA
jgi:NTP pyrophosphatase (non-canonical NTP hydrolase)